MTGRELSTRKAEHFSKATTGHADTMLAQFIRKTGARSSEWTIYPIIETPLYPECVARERATIYHSKLKPGMLNEQVLGSLSETQNIKFDCEQLEDYPGVYLYKRENHKLWSFGYRGRGMTDHDGVWKEEVTDFTDKDDAMFSAVQYFEEFRAVPDIDVSGIYTNEPQCGVGMSQQQNSLLIVQEELAEVAVELLQLQNTISKAMRFGLHEQHGELKKNHERIQDEWNDLLGSLSNLGKHGFSLAPDLDKIAAKMAKVEKYTEYSTHLGVVL